MRRVYGANHVLHSVAEKNEAHHEFAADLVDTESHVFAAWAKANGRRWGIVRAVSDDAETAIPASIENWTRADGRPNLPVIAKDLITHPQWIPVVQRLARTSRDAMQQLIALLCQLRIGESDSKRTRS